MSKPYLIIVDDDEELAAIIRLCAEGMGFDVDWVGNGKLFKSALETRIPDVITLDIVMPEVEGTEILQWMAGVNVAIPVILMSGYNEFYIKAANTIGKKGGLNMLGTLRKPFSLDDLEALLEQALENEDTPQSVSSS